MSEMRSATSAKAYRETTFVKHAFKQRWARWLDRRIPLSRAVQLGHRSIFIIPSSTGFLFGLLLVLLLVTAINYQNSLVYAVCFWLFSMAMGGMFFTFRNLKGLTLSAREAVPCYAGEAVDIPIRMDAEPGRSHLSLRMKYPGGGAEGNPSQIVSVMADSENQVSLSYRTEKRGRLRPGRLKLETRFPLGLYQAWSYVNLDVGSLVYPKPVFTPFVFASADTTEGDLEGAVQDVAGDQDFRGLRPYQPGDSLKQIAWKQLARGKGLVTKDFDSDQGASCWLDWNNLTGDTEARLSQLCGWVLTAHEEGLQYGVKMPGWTAQPAHTVPHLTLCLRQLALFGLEEETQP